MNKQELIKKYEEYENGLFDIGARAACQLFLKDLEQLDEPEKIKIPQFVADWIEEARKTCKDVADVFDFDFTNEEVGKWFMQERPFDLVARAWLDGYEVEEEKRYLVKMKGMSEENTYLTFRFGHTWMLSNFEECEEFRLHHTRKQLEDADFDWVFDCPGIEIEEMEHEN